MATLRPEDERAEREAADWFAQLNTLSITTHALERFQAWRRTPANDAAYERMEALWALGGRLQQDPDIRRGLARALDRAPGQRGLGGWRLAIPRRTGAIALVAGLALAIAISIIAVQAGQYRTSVGEQRLVTLSDGTRMRLDTDSRVRVRLGDRERDVTLLRGRAFFDVAHDGARPFLVQADGAQVRAVGTRFDVRLAGDDVKVTLVEGVVDVTQAGHSKAWRLTPGESLIPGDAAAQPRRVDVAATTSWTSGRLTFRETPLAQAVAEVNRYSRRKVVIEGARLQRVPISGVFDVGDTEAFVAAVADLFELKAEPRDGQIRLTPRASSQL